MIRNRKDFENGLVVYRLSRVMPDGKPYAHVQAFSKLVPRVMIAHRLRHARKELRDFRARYLAEVTARTQS